MIRIGIDAMGGDYAPENVILGVIDAYSHIGSDTKIFLIGDQEKITEVCRHYGLDSGNFVVIHASQTLGMGEHPVSAYLHKSDSSVSVGFNKLVEGEIDAFASAGNTGAMLTGSVMTLKTLPGLLRPCISAQIPLADGKNMLILDVGLNTDTKPAMLYQFAILGSIYAKTMMGIENPRVALTISYSIRFTPFPYYTMGKEEKQRFSFRQKALAFCAYLWYNTLTCRVRISVIQRLPKP